MYGTRNQVVLPLNLETKIKGDVPVFKLAEICDTLDYTELYKAYVRTYRKYDPAMLFAPIALYLASSSSLMTHLPHPFIVYRLLYNLYPMFGISHS